MKYLGDYTEDYATLSFCFSTHTAAGTPITLAGTPAVSVFQGNSATPITAGITLTVGFATTTGLHNVLIDLSASASYAVAKDYSIVITTGTVDSISVVGTVLATFSIENRFLEADITKVAGAAVSTSTAQLGVNVVSMAAGQLVAKKNVALSNFAFPMFDSAGDLKSGLTVAVALRKDAGSFAASTNSAPEIGTTGWYTINFVQAEMNADAIAFSATAAGAKPTTYTILTQA